MIIFIFISDWIVECGLFSQVVVALMIPCWGAASPYTEYQQLFAQRNSGCPKKKTFLS